MDQDKSVEKKDPKQEKIESFNRAGLFLQKIYTRFLKRKLSRCLSKECESTVQQLN